MHVGKSYNFQDLTGGLNTVSSIGTINQSPRRTESPDMLNVEYFQLGGIRSMEGNIQVGDTLDSPIIGGWDYIQGKNRYLMVATQRGGVYILNGATETFDKIYQFPSTSNTRVSFVNMNDGVVFSNGRDDLVYYQRGRHKLLTGTVSVASGSTSVVGTATEFEKEVSVGDYLSIDGLDGVYKVEDITDDTHLTFANPVEEAVTDALFYLDTISECNAVLVNEDDPNTNIPIRGTALQYFKGRLWVGSGSTVYYSQLGQYNKWDIKYEAGGIGDFYNDTSDVLGLGLFGDYLLIHKEHFTYLLAGGNDPDNWTLTPYANITAESQQSWVVTNAKYFVFSRSNMGVYPLTQRTVFNDKYIGNEISVKIRNIFSELRLADLDEIYAVAHPSKRWLMMYMPFASVLGSSKCIIFDFQTSSWLLRQVPQVVTIAFNYNNEVYIGTNDGKVLREFYGKTFDGEFLEAYWKSPWFSMGDDSYFKTFDEFYIQISEEDNNSFYLRGYRDKQSPYTQRYITNDFQDVNALIWDGETPLPDNETTWDNNDWVRTSLLDFRFPMELNMFENYQIELRTAELGQGFSCYGFGFRRAEYDEARW